MGCSGLVFIDPLDLRLRGSSHSPNLTAVPESRAELVMRDTFMAGWPTDGLNGLLGETLVKEWETSGNNTPNLV